DFGLDRQRLIQILLVARGETQHRWVRCTNRLIQTKYRFIARAVLCQNSRLGCEARKQYSKKQHRERNAKEGRNHERPEQVIKPVFEPYKYVLVSLPRQFYSRFEHYVVRKGRFFDTWQQAAHGLVGLQLSSAGLTQMDMKLQLF